MELIVHFDGCERRVRTERDGDRWRIEIDGRIHDVDEVATGSATRSLLIDGHQHEVVVLRGRERDGYRVSTRRGPETVEVLDLLTHLARETRAETGGGGSRQVAAYMPGRVVAVLVEEGSEVVAGQGIVVLEAMKMENEIQADRAGTIETIHVRPGQPVEGGDPLFDLAALPG